MASATINIFGDLSGFWPAAATAIRTSPLPYVLAIGNCGLLLVLLWRLALPNPLGGSQTAPTLTRSP
jgi:hypothetical protein